MKLTSIIAIYGLFWVLGAMLVLPFGLRTPDETGDNVTSGHADSAPVNFNPNRIARRATVLSVVLFGLYYANFVNGWITTDDINFFGTPPSYDGSR